MSAESIHFCSPCLITGAYESWRNKMWSYKPVIPSYRTQPSKSRLVSSFYMHLHMYACVCALLLPAVHFICLCVSSFNNYPFNMCIHVCMCSVSDCLFYMCTHVCGCITEMSFYLSGILYDLFKMCLDFFIFT